MLLEILSHADYLQVNCFVPTQLVKNKSMIAVTGVERFQCDEGSIKKAMLRSHLDCQGGLPQNTLAKSALKILDCQGGQPEEYLGQEQGYVEYVPEV